MYDTANIPQLVDAIKQLQQKFDSLSARVESMDETLAAISASVVHSENIGPGLVMPEVLSPEKLAELQRTLDELDPQVLAEMTAALDNFFKKT